MLSLRVPPPRQRFRPGRDRVAEWGVERATPGSRRGARQICMMTHQHEEFLNHRFRPPAARPHAATYCDFMTWRCNSVMPSHSSLSLLSSSVIILSVISLGKMVPVPCPRCADALPMPCPRSADALPSCCRRSARWKSEHKMKFCARVVSLCHLVKLFPRANPFRRACLFISCYFQCGQLHWPQCPFLQGGQFSRTALF